MALDKTGVNIPFGQGMSTKVDEFQIPIGKYQALSNTVFDTLQKLKKRNGFGALPAILGSSSYLATYQNNLLTVGTFNAGIAGGEAAAHTQNLWGYSQSYKQWINSGAYEPLNFTVQSVIKNAYSVTSVDQAYAPNGLVCTVYASGIPKTPYQYVITDSLTGQNVLTPTAINTVGSGFSERFTPRVFMVGPNFVIAYDSFNQANSAASTYSLLLRTISSAAPLSVGSVTTVSSACNLATQWTRPAFDGVVASQTLYLAWNCLTGAGVAATSVNVNNQRTAIVQISSSNAAVFSLCSDTTTSNSFIYTSMSLGSGSILGTADGQTIRFTCFDANVSPIFSAQSAVSSGSGVYNLVSTAKFGSALVTVEGARNYTYDTSVGTNGLSQFIVSSNTTIFPENQLIRSVGLASKAFVLDSVSYFLTTYQTAPGAYQNTYFLVNQVGNVVAKVAYGNGFGYTPFGLPSVYVNGTSASIPYLFQESITPVNKTPNPATGIQTAGVYSSFGINAGTFNFNTNLTSTKEVGSDLCLNGGFLWSYDGVKPTENNFFLYPDAVEVTFNAGASAQLAADTYYYQATYEWTDNQGNIFRSAPSLPVQAIINSIGSSVTINVPTLRLTYKGVPTIGLYRWSTQQPIFYKITSNILIDSGALASESVRFTDSKSNASIIGGEILYTNGGVVEDANGPISNALCEFDSRLWLIDAEDANLLWFSKQVIEATPVEMSELLTYYVSPTAGGAGPTGPCKCLAQMDDKLVIFKGNSIFYINGTGPDNTGANNQYSPSPIFITGALGCSNQSSIVLTQLGLLFQSDKGIWLLGRDLSVKYVGEAVEVYNSSTVVSAQLIPGTNQVRFQLNNGLILIFDYYADQWGTFSGPASISGTVQNSLHTILNSSGQVAQETIGSYSDFGVAVTLGFTTGWINLAGLQGYERAYKLYLLGQYITPHNYTVGVAYDYNPAIVQTALINPTNSLGSGSTVEQWEIGFQKQQCQAFQLTFTEVSSQSAGAGLTLSGMNVVYGVKKTFPRNISPSNTTG